MEGMCSDRTQEDRFWSLVNKSDQDGCWLWVGYTQTRGYGTFKIDNAMKLAHRVAWEIVRGPIPDGMVVDHDNPDYGCHQPACVNPNHLQLVTKSVNSQRKRGLAANNTSGVRGVTWHARNQKWMVQVIANGKKHNGGCFDNLAEAEKKAKALRSWLHA